MFQFFLLINLFILLSSFSCCFCKAPSIIISAIRSIALKVVKVEVGAGVKAGAGAEVGAEDAFTAVAFLTFLTSLRAASMTFFEGLSVVAEPSFLSIATNQHFTCMKLRSTCSSVSEIQH